MFWCVAHQKYEQLRRQPCEVNEDSKNWLSTSRTGWLQEGSYVYSQSYRERSRMKVRFLCFQNSELSETLQHIVLYVYYKKKKNRSSSECHFVSLVEYVSHSLCFQHEFGDGDGAFIYKVVHARLALAYRQPMRSMATTCGHKQIDPPKTVPHLPIQA